MHRAPSLRCLIGLTCLTLALGLLPAPARARGEDDDAAAAFRELLRADWDHRMEHSPEEASLLGDRRFDTLLTDRSVASFERRREDARQLLKRVESHRSRETRALTIS